MGPAHQHHIEQYPLQQREQDYCNEGKGIINIFVGSDPDLKKSGSEPVFFYNSPITGVSTTDTKHGATGAQTCKNNRT